MENPRTPYLYIVCYDLAEGRDESDLAKTLIGLTPGGGWWRQLYCSWVVISDRSAAEIREALLPHLQPDETLLIGRLHGDIAWAGFSDQAAQWLKDMTGSSSGPAH